MDLYVGIAGVLCFLGLVVFGMPVAYAAAFVGGIGILIIRGLDGMMGALGYLPYAIIANYSFGVIPMFVLMGFIAYQSGMARDIFWAIRQWVGHVHGGLAIATVFGCTAFGATSGSSTSDAAVFGKIAIPEMIRYKYDRRLAAGTVAASGTLAALIPPSMLIVIYGLLTEQSIAQLLLAGIIPGVLTAAIYAFMLWFRIRLNPGLGLPADPAPWKVRFISLKAAWSPALIFGLLVGGIYTGIFTPTEAGGIAAFAAFLIALVVKKLRFIQFRDALLETVSISVMVLAILVGTIIFMHFLALSGVTRAVIVFVASLPVGRMMVLIGMLFIYLILGCFISATAMIMLTLPIFFPVIVKLGFDPIWFGILVIKMCEVAVITPPLGLNVYAVRSVTPDISTVDIFRGIFPFLIMEFFILAILVAFPQLTLFLPRQIG